MSALAGKVALVTGASRGIGRAIARRLAADGALVAVHYGHDARAAEETIADIESAGGQGFPVAADLADPCSWFSAPCHSWARAGGSSTSPHR